MGTKAFALRPIGPDLCHRDANGHAGVAPIAIWAVGEPPAPPEPLPDELAIDDRVDQMDWRRDLRPRDMIDLQSFLWVQGSAEYG